MNPKFLGDSYDCVKRVFCAELKALGYEVCIDPMFTGEWTTEMKTTFYDMVGMTHFNDVAPNTEETVLFLDPDTGIQERRSTRHVTFERIEECVKNYALVFVFDQSFSFNGNRHERMQEKLRELHKRDCRAFYYASHAPVLFAFKKEDHGNRTRAQLLALGVPSWRIVTLATA